MTFEITTLYSLPFSKAAASVSSKLFFTQGSQKSYGFKAKRDNELAVGDMKVHFDSLAAINHEVELVLG